MPRKCAVTGKKTHSGGKYSRRGKAKYLGGVGVKVTSHTKRTFAANIQRVRALVDGKVVRIKVSAKVIGRGGIVKPLRRDYTPPAEQA